MSPQDASTLVAHTIRIDTVTTDPSGVWRITYTYDGSGGHGIGFSTKEDAIQRILDFTNDDIALTLALMYWYARDSTLTQEAPIVGKNVTIDPSAGSFIRVQ